VDGEHVSETPCPMLAGLLASIVMICLWIQVVITKLNNFEQFSLRTTIGLGFFEFEWRNHRLSALHQTLGEPVGVSNAAELYTNLVPQQGYDFVRVVIDRHCVKDIITMMSQY